MIAATGIAAQAEAAPARASLPAILAPGLESERGFERLDEPGDSNPSFAGTPYMETASRNPGFPGTFRLREASGRIEFPDAAVFSEEAMKRSIAMSLISAACAAAFLACILAPWGRSFADGEKPALTVEIAVPEKAGKRVIPLAGEFHVVLTNVSGEPLEVLSQACPQGRSQMYFEITDENGSSWTLRRKDENVRRNILVAETLAPGEPMVIHVDLSSPAWEQTAPLDSYKGRKLAFRAVFDSASLTGTAGITGKLDSEGRKIESDGGSGGSQGTPGKPNPVKTWNGKVSMPAARMYTIE